MREPSKAELESSWSLLWQLSKARPNAYWRLPRPGRPLSRRNSLENELRKPCVVPSIPHRRSTRPSAPRVSCRPFAFGNTSPDSSVSIQASASTASTRPESGTLCSRFAFILDAGTVHVVASRSNSSHQGRRGSLPQDHGVLPTPNPRGDPEDHEPIDRKRMARLSSQMSRSHHPVEKAMAPVPVRDARQSFPPFDAIFSPFKHGSIRYGRTASAADRAVLVQLRRFLAGIQALGTPRYQHADEDQLRNALDNRRRVRA